MFDIGFSELLMIGVVALIVIGPERLPKVARTAGHLYGRMQRYVSSVKTDISREMEFDELRRSGQQFKESIEASVSDVQEQTSMVDDYLRDETSSIRNAVEEAGMAVGERSSSKPANAFKQSESNPQQSLLLDEPDQNGATAPSAVVETARHDSDGKAA